MTGLARAQLIELKQDFSDVKPDGQSIEVQFNPESLKVTFANEIKQPEGGDQSSGNAGRQFVGAGTTKLALALWFDVTAMEKDAVDDVRRLTQKVIFFMTPQPSEADKKKMVPPGIRFLWGSFKFDGIVEGLEETLDFFSPDGKPLRANVTLTLSQQKILVAEFKGDGKVPDLPGQKPLKSARQNQSLQNMAAGAGKNDWQSIGAANGIEDPLRMAPGQLVDLDASVSADASFGAGASIGGGLSLSADASASTAVAANTSLNASLGGAASASLRIG
jgi:hypothetical protein